LYDEAIAYKQKAIAKVGDYKYFKKAEGKFSKAHDLLSKTELKDSNELLNKELLLCLYKYEQFDCAFSFQIKKKNFNEAKRLNGLQQELLINILAKYDLFKFPNEYLATLYTDLKQKHSTAKFQKYYPIAKYYFDQEEFYLSYENFKLSRDVLKQIDTSQLSSKSLDVHNRNLIIVNVNIAMSLIGIENNETKYAENYLYIFILKQLLFCLDEANKIIEMTNDSYYQDGKEKIIKNIKHILNTKQNLWNEIFIELSENDTIIRYAQEIDGKKYNEVINSLSINQKKTYKLLFIVHGFNTRGPWKNDLVELIDADEISGNCKFIKIPWDYNQFGYIKFVTPFCRKIVYNKFQALYSNKASLYVNDIDSIVIVAHSFGTRITSYGMTRNKNIKFNRMILLGNILRRNFDWPTLYNNKQIEKVLVEVNKKDWVLIIAKAYSLLPWVNWIGNAGRKGFDKAYSFIEEKRGNDTHSSMLKDLNSMENSWIPFLKN
jgi:hypothetical protein